MRSTLAITLSWFSALSLSRLLLSWRCVRQWFSQSCQHHRLVESLQAKCQAIFQFNHPASFKPFAHLYQMVIHVHTMRKHACKASLQSKWVGEIILVWKLRPRIVISPLLYTSWILSCNDLELQHSFIQNLTICRSDRKVFEYEISLKSDFSFFLCQSLSLRFYVTYGSDEPYW